MHNVDRYEFGEITDTSKPILILNQVASQFPAPALADLTLPTMTTPRMLPGAPFTDGTRAAVASAATNRVNAQLNSHGISRSAQVQAGDLTLENMLTENQTLSGINYAPLHAQEQLINNQDLSLINLGGGHDLIQAQEMLLNQEDNDLTREIQSLTGN